MPHVVRGIPPSPLSAYGGQFPVPHCGPPPRPADASVGISAVVATKAVAAKQAITDFGMAPLRISFYRTDDLRIGAALGSLSTAAEIIVRNKSS
jgi:hypothetical protein